MTEQEKQILKNLVEVIPDMDELQRMYLLGQAEGMAFMKKKQSEKNNPRPNQDRGNGKEG
jgi:hypothetical protein